jgi:hypothetical protein
MLCDPGDGGLEASTRCVMLYAPLAYDNFFPREGYHVVITVKMFVNIRSRQLAGNTRTFSGDKSISARGYVKGFDPWHLFLWPQSSEI